MSDGMAKNWEHITEEVLNWRNNMGPYWRMFQDADGVGEKLHKAMNLVTESVRLLSYTLAHALVLGAALDGALHVWLWVR